MPQYPQEGGAVKLAAGWLIEQSGWKDTLGDHGVHDKQACLVHLAVPQVKRCGLWPRM